MSRMNMNMICLIGAVIGTLAVFISWCYFPNNGGSPRSDWGPLSPGKAWIVIPPSLLSIFSFLVIGGTALAFVSPLGGFLQTSGVLLYLFYFTPPLPKASSAIPEVRLIPAMGPFFAIISSSLVVVSFLWPLGFGYKKPIGSWGRLLTISPSGIGPGGVSLDAPLPRELWSSMGIALAFGGAGASIYAFRAAPMIDYFAAELASNARPLLYLLGILGAIVGALGCLLFFYFRHGRSRHKVPHQSSQ